jgi:mRNA interferase HigB
MNVLSKPTIIKIYQKHAAAKQDLPTWYDTVTNATWKNINDLHRSYPDTNLVGDDRFVFNIHGNRYRLVALISFLIKTLRAYRPERMPNTLKLMLSRKF